MTHLKTCVIERKLLTKNFKNTIQASSTDAFLIQYLHPKKSTFKVPKFHSRANVDTFKHLFRQIIVRLQTERVMHL